MAEIRPLRGVRFDGRRSGPVGSLLAPPYDVASLNGHIPEYSISAIENVHLGVDGNPHLVAAERYQSWLAGGVLAPDEHPAIYLHRHRFDSNGETTMRSGLLARIRLQEWADRVVLPHERTNPGPRLERLERLRTVGANLSPLYFLYRDPDAAIQNVISACGPPVRDALEERDRTGGSHVLSPVFDEAIFTRLEEAFAKRTLFVADGHHRYEAALAYRDEMRSRHPGVDGPWEFVLALLSSVEDPGVIVRPTHRVLAGGNPPRAGELHALLERWFAVEPETRDDKPLFRVADAEEKTVWPIYAKPGDPHLALMPGQRGRAWRSLAIAAVDVVLGSLLGAGQDWAERRIEPVVDEGLALDKVRSGEAHAAFLLPAPDIGRLLAVAEEGDLLPAKSTWFEPKAPAGLVINDFALSAAPTDP